MGAINIRRVVESHMMNSDKESPNEKNIQELNKKLEKLLLIGENKNNTKEE